MPFLTRTRLPRTRLSAVALSAVLTAGACGSGAATTTTTRPASGVSTAASAPAPSTSADPAVVLADEEFAALEAQYDTRLGVYVLDTATDRTVVWRAGERFPYASSIKAALAGAVLAEASRRDLDEVLRYDAADLVPNSPITEERLADGVTVREAIDAMLRFSDNTAANLLFAEIDGPRGLDRALDRLGDEVTEPSRIEPDLNTAVPGDPRDTSSPQALATTTARYVVGRALPRPDRQLLRSTMVASTTGDALIRAGVPDSWIVADKTGGADYGVRNDVGVAFPPQGAPVLIAVMSARDQVEEEYDDAVVAEATRIAVEALDLG